MWIDYKPENLKNVPKRAGLYLIRSKSKGAIVYVGKSDVGYDIRSRLVAHISEKESAQNDNVRKHYMKHPNDLQFRCIVRGGSTPMLDAPAAEEFLIITYKPEYNIQGKRKSSSAYAHDIIALQGLGKCPCCGRPW